MTTGYRDASAAFQGLAAIRYRNAASALKDVAAVHYRDASNVLKTLVGAGGGTLSAPVTPDTCYGFGSSPSSIYINTDAASVAASGGTPPYSYDWTVADAGWSPISDGSAASAFRSPTLGPGADSGTTAYCTVTDSLGATGISNTISLYAANIWSGLP